MQAVIVISNNPSKWEYIIYTFTFTNSNSMTFFTRLKNGTRRKPATTASKLRITNL